MTFTKSGWRAAWNGRWRRGMGAWIENDYYLLSNILLTVKEKL
jgi:hypothetical protein